MRRITTLIGASLMLGACAANDVVQTSGAPSEPAQQSCAGVEFSQMDFWLGEWSGVWEGGQGTNRITKVLDGCVVQEDFDASASTENLVGRSVSTFHRGIGQWRQTWVDNKGGYFSLVGGPVGENFVLTNTRVRDDAPYLRMVFEDIQSNSFTWRWQRSADAGATWTDLWVIQYRRRRP